MFFVIYPRPLQTFGGGIVLSPYRCFATMPMAAPSLYPFAVRISICFAGLSSAEETF